MKKIDLKMLFITSVICLIPIVLGIAYYNDLPDKVAVHFNIYDNPDKYLSKTSFVFGLPIIMTLIQVLLCVVVDIKSGLYTRGKLATCKWIMPLITIVMYTVTLLYASNVAINMRKVAMIVIGIIFIIIGNLLPRIENDKNINFPKIKNKEKEAKIKKIYGYLFIIDGLLTIMSIAFNSIVSIGTIALLVLQTIILEIVVLIINRNEKG